VLAGIGTVRRLFILAIRGIAIAACLAGQARSEEPERPYTPSNDEAVALVLNQKEKGVVIFDAIVSPFRCGAKYTMIGRKVGDRWQKDIFGGGNWGMRAIVPGEYTIFGVGCDVGLETKDFKGPFATFRVGPGELVDIGVLKLEVKIKSAGLLGPAPSGTLHKSVERSSPDMDKRNKQRLPTSFARVIRRPMTIVGPVDVGIKEKGLFE